MLRSSKSWSGSVNYRFEWWPSRLLACILLMLGVLAVFSVLASGVAWWIAVVSIPAICGYVVWAFCRHLRAAPRLLVIPNGETSPTLDGVVLTQLKVQWRGPLACMAWRDAHGASGHLVWWPDVLNVAQRRELRLSTDSLPLSRSALGMAS